MRPCDNLGVSVLFSCAAVADGWWTTFHPKTIRKFEASRSNGCRRRMWHAFFISFSLCPSFFLPLIHVISCLSAPFMALHTHRPPLMNIHPLIHVNHTVVPSLELSLSDMHLLLSPTHVRKQSLTLHFGRARSLGHVSGKPRSCCARKVS